MENTEKKISNFRDKYAFLSNFYNSKIKHKGIVYNNAESLFQCAKCKNNEDVSSFRGISGKEAKALGKRVELREDWDKIKDDIMCIIVKKKFYQNKFLAQKLLDTGDTIIEEGNYWNDNYWGVCYCRKCNGEHGKNVLGKILMKVRGELRDEP